MNNEKYIGLILDERNDYYTILLVTEKHLIYKN